MIGDYYLRRKGKRGRGREKGRESEREREERREKEDRGEADTLLILAFGVDSYDLLDEVKVFIKASEENPKRGHHFPDHSFFPSFFSSVRSLILLPRRVAD